MLSFVSFMSSAIITGFYLTHIQQKSFFKEVFKKTPKFNYQFDYEANQFASLKFRYAYFMDWVPLYSRIKNNYFYNLLFNGLTSDYENEISHLSLFENVKNDDSLKTFFDIFDLSNPVPWQQKKTSMAVNNLTTVSIEHNHIFYKVAPDFLVDTLQRAWVSRAYQTTNAYFKSTADYKIALIQKKPPSKNEKLNYLSDLTDFIHFNLAYWISNSVAEIFNRFVADCVKQLPNKTIGALNAVFSKKNFPFIFRESHQYRSSVAENRNIELLYEFIFGKARPNNSIFWPEYCQPYALTFASAAPDTLLNVDKDGDHRFESGLRGMVSPITTQAFFLGDGNLIFKKRLLISNQLIDDNYTYKGSRLYRFERHIGLVADLTDWRLQLRQERIIFDINNQKTYRLVFLNNRLNSRSDYVDPLVISGRKPFFNNEVMISPQFARNNHIKLGSWINMNSNLLHVIGIATDPFSFLPNFAGRGSVFPDTKHTAVIYLLQQKKLLNLRPTASHFFGFITQKVTSTTDTDMSVQAGNFLACLGVNSERLPEMINFLGTNRDDLTHHVLLPSSNEHIENDDLKLTTFANSPFRWNWQLFSYLMHFLDAIGLIGLAVLLLLLMLITIVVSSRLIKNNQRSIGYLRASGFGILTTSWRYSWWSLLLLPLPLIFGWIIGCFLPGFLNLIFANVFSSIPHLTFAGIYLLPLVVAICLVMIVNLATSLLVFVKYLRLGPVEMIRKDFRVQISPWLLRLSGKWGNWLKTRFGLDLTHYTIRSRFRGSSFRQLIVFMVSIFVISTIAGLVLLIPNSLTKLKRFYFGDLRYQNEFSYATPASNSPLSKYAFNFWPGPKLWDRYQHDGAIITDPSGHTIGGFEQLADYNAVSGLSGFFPTLLFGKGLGSYRWGYNLFLDDNNDFDNALLLSHIADLAYANQGRSVSLAGLDYLLAQLLHANPQNSNLSTWDTTKRLRLVDDASLFFNSYAFKLFLKEALKAENLDMSEDYHDFMLDVLRTNFPNELKKQVLTSPARTFTFRIGWHNMLNLPEQDVLTEQLPVTINDRSRTTSLHLLGLDTTNNNTKYVNTESASNDGNLRLESTTIQKLKDQLRIIARANFTGNSAWGQDVYDQQGHIIYSAQDHTLYLPTLVNRLAQVALKVKVNSVSSADLSPAMHVISFLTKNNRFKPILKQFWVYNDDDFAQVVKNSSQEIRAQWEDYKKSRYLPEQNPDGHDFNLLDPFALPNQAFSFIPSFDEKGQLLPNTTAFVDYDTSDQHTTNPFPRPLFNFQNVQLYLPQKLIDLDTFAHPDPSATDQTGQFLTSNIAFNSVPSSVTAGFSRDKWPKWVCIRPFAPEYDKRFDPSDTKNNISLFTKKIKLWSFAAFFNEQNPILRLSQISAGNSVDQNPLLGLHIRPQFTGIINGGHDGENLYVNPALALLIGNYSLARSHNFRFANFYGKQTLKSLTINGQPLRLVYSDPATAINSDPRNHFWFKNEGDRPYLWSNNKFSHNQDPFDLDANAANVYKPLLGVNNMLGTFGPIQNRGLSVIDANLNYQKKYFVDNLTRIGMIIAIFMILVIVINSFLATYLICDIFIRHYSKFMVILKMEGYSLGDLLAITVPIFIPYLLFGWAGSVGLIFSVTAIIGYVALHYFGVYLPFLASWWLFLITLSLVMVIFLTATLLIPWRFSANSIKLARQENLFS